MIVHRKWREIRKIERFVPKDEIDEDDPHDPLQTIVVWKDGWFLFGLLPIYVREYRLEKCD